MPRPKRLLQQTAEDTTSPPSALPPTQQIARVLQATGNNLYNVTLAASSTHELASLGSPLLVELPPRFRNQIWIRRGGYVVVDLEERERENKIQGEIVNVVRDMKEWRRMEYWPKEFVERGAVEADSEEEDNRVGKMPSSDEED